MSIAEIQRMPRTEKLKLMEALWADLAGEEGSVKSPSWHWEELRKTEKRLAAGKEKAVDWAVAKRRLRKTFE